MSQKISIVGGGIGGLSLAATLSHFDVDYQLFEQAPEPRTTGFAITIQKNAIDALRLIGLDSAVMDAGHLITRLRIDSPRGRVLTEMATEMYALQRVALQETLAAAVPAGRLRFDRHVETPGEGWTIAADGVHSSIRAYVVGEDLSPRVFGCTAWRGMTPVGAVALPGEQLDTAIESWGRAKRFGLAPLRGGQVYWFAVIRNDIAANVAPSDAKPFLAEQADGWHEPIGRLIEATPADAILATPVVDRAPTPRWHRARVLLLGDAAHPMTPFLGQGGCQAIEDAVTLGHLFAAVREGRLDEASLAASYERMRKSRVDRIVELSRQTGRIGDIRNPVLIALRNLAMRMTPASVQQRRMRSMHEFPSPKVSASLST
jgi:2-polyprenyl-6-methoxyphenol hydroxylase-like FAD-dependent oxidoreductase